MIKSQTAPSPSSHPLASAAHQELDAWHCNSSSGEPLREGRLVSPVIPHPGKKLRLRAGPFHARSHTGEQGMVWKPGLSGSEALAVADSQCTQTSTSPRHSQTLAAGTTPDHSCSRCPSFPRKVTGPGLTAGLRAGAGGLGVEIRSQPHSGSHRTMLRNIHVHEGGWGGQSARLRYDINGATPYGRLQTWRIVGQ